MAQLINYYVDYGSIPFASLSESQQAYVQEAWRRNATVGASGAIMGVLAAFGYTFPNTTLFIMPIPFPIKAKWAIMGIIALDVFGGISKVPGDNIAHFAHVGGAIIGIIIVIIWNRTNKQTFY